MKNTTRLGNAMTLADLITAAAQAAGSQNDLADALGVKAQRLSDWKHGRIPCPITTQARIAEIAGEDPKEWVWQCVCHQLGRVTVAALSALAVTLAALSAPGAGGGSGLARPRKA